MYYHAKKSEDVDREIHNRHKLIHGEYSRSTRQNNKNDPFKNRFAPQVKYEEGDE